jgi:hypothetical protein
MPRIAILNCAIGFFLLSLALCGGIFLSFASTQAFLFDKSLLTSWWFTLARSAHTHASQCGLLHIAFGLSLPYSPWGRRVKTLQTLLLAMGSVAMSLLLLLRAYQGESGSFSMLGLLIGGGIMAALATLASHCYGLVYKLLR